MAYLPESLLGWHFGASGTDYSHPRCGRMAGKPLCRKSTGAGIEDICGCFFDVYFDLYAGGDVKIRMKNPSKVAGS